MITYRSPISTIQDALRILAEGPTSITKIVRRCNMNSPRVKKLVADMQAKGLIKPVGRHWGITEKGARVLDLADDIQAKLGGEVL